MVCTLSNVNPYGEGMKSPDDGFTPTHSLDAEKHGVSLDYDYNPTKKWYVLRATYGREKKAYDYIVNDGTIAYLPLRYVQKSIEGRKKRILAPLLPNILFVYSEKEKINEYLKQTPELSYLRYYYNHLETDANGVNPPMVVEYKEMNNFIEATNVDDEHLRVVNLSQCHFKSGDKVRVIEGAFRGVQGYVARVAGQQRVIVTIDGLCSIATAYIPSAFIEKIE
jgi:transcription antitermination factor NusG